jgi:hypothetical protein
MTSKGLPRHGVTETLIDADDEDARTAVRAALADTDPGAALRRAAATHPTHLDAWARLAEHALAAGDPVAGYAFARTGYHRGLDRVRKAGWRGEGPVPWHHEPNRGFLRSVRALERTAREIGETDEAERCRAFLAELDPDGDAWSEA